jgi:hypothetical protein
MMRAAAAVPRGRPVAGGSVRRWRAALAVGLAPVLPLSMPSALSFVLSLLLLVAGPPRAAAQDSYAAFWRAMQSDNASALQALLARGMDPNTVDERGEPALLVTLRIGLPNTAAVLLRHPALRVDQQNALGETALMLAVYREQEATVVALLGRGARVDTPGWSPLHYAAEVGAVGLARMLVNAGAPIDSRSPNDTTPLMMAARNGHSAMARWLLERGADRAARNALGWTAAEFARRADFTALAAQLAGSP